MRGSVDGWRGLVAAVGQAGDAVAALDGRAPEVDVAEGFRYVLDVLGDQVDRAALRHSAQPLFLPSITPVRKLFFDNPDTHYDTAQLRAGRSYRIRGHRGDATYLAFCVYAGDIARGEPTRVANLSDADMAFGPDGAFALTLSPGPPPGAGPDGRADWIEIPPDAHTVIARQYFLDRAGQAPARYAIEPLDDPGPDPVLDGAAFARLAQGVGAFVGAAVAVAVERVERGRAQPNRFVPVRGHALYGTPDAGYVACWYRLAPGEALVVEARPPPCRYWGVHLANRWGQSLDHRTRTTALNARTVSTGPAAPFRIVVAPAAPGVPAGGPGAPRAPEPPEPDPPGRPDWLDTAGHPEGWVLFRWLLAEEAVVPEARVVKLAALRDTPAGDR